MKTTIFNLIFILVIAQFTFSQIQVSCGNVTSVVGSSSNISLLNMNDCNGDIEIRIDENLLSNNEGVTIEGELSKNRKSIRIVGHQNHSISLVPFNKDNTLQKKVVSYKGELPEERKTRVSSNKEDPKGSVKSRPLENITIYPNPVSVDLIIQTQSTVLSYIIATPQGNILLQEYFPDTNTIDVSNLTNGLYYIQIQTLQQVATRQFIKN